MENATSAARFAASVASTLASRPSRAAMRSASDRVVIADSSVAGTALDRRRSMDLSNEVRQTVTNRRKLADRSAQVSDIRVASGQHREAVDRFLEPLDSGVCFWVNRQGILCLPLFDVRGTPSLRLLSTTIGLGGRVLGATCLCRSNPARFAA